MNSFQTDFFFIYYYFFFQFSNKDKDLKNGFTLTFKNGSDYALNYIASSTLVLPKWRKLTVTL